MTLADLAGLVTRPTPEVTERLRRSVGELSDELGQLAYALDKLLSRSLRGMFDGCSTVSIRWDGPGIVLDLSVVPIDSEALPLVMVAAAGWLSQLMTGAGPPAGAGDRRGVGAARQPPHRPVPPDLLQPRPHLRGVEHLHRHRPSDLGAQADDGTATAKIAVGLLADAATKILLRQAPDQLDAASKSFGLTEPERHIVGQLARGRALWKVAGHTAVVQHMLTPAEMEMCDTDGRMVARPSLVPAAA